MNITVTFEDSMRECIMERLPYDKNDPETKEELNKKSIDNLLIIFLNWSRRLVATRPRKVFISKELSQELEKPEHPFKHILQEIVSNIEDGRPLTARLSKQIVEYGYVKKSSSNGNDKDLLLNDWNIHHLHLGSKPDAQDPRFFERKDELLFVAFKDTEAFIINIYDHKSWVKRDVVETIVKNWPDKEIFVELKGVLSSNEDLMENDYKKLRKNHVATLMNIDGKTYAPTGALTTAGTSMYSNMAARNIFEKIKAFKKLCENTPEDIVAAFTKKGCAWPEYPHFKFVFLDDKYGFYEINTKAFVPLG